MRRIPSLLLGLMTVLGPGCGLKGHNWKVEVRSGKASLQEESSGFTAYCENSSDPEIAYTAEALKHALKIDSCKDIEAFLASAVQLKIKNERLQNIDFLAYAPSLVSLDLQINAISDITPIAQLKKLRTLDLTNNLVKDMRPLLELPELTELGITQNPLENPEIFKQLPQLQTIKASDCGLTDLKIFAGMNGLESLSVAKNIKLTDIRPLVGLKKLRELNISENTAITDPAPLLEMPSIVSLGIGRSGIENLAFLEKMPQLSKLSIYPNATSGYGVISKLPNLKDLDFAHRANDSSTTDIIDYSFLSTLGPQLRRLSIIDGKFSSPFAYLSSLPNLEELELRSFDLPVNAFNAMPKLKSLIVSVSSCAPAGEAFNLPKLETFSSNFISCVDLSYLKGAPALKSLTLAMAGPALSLDTLGGLSQIEALDISGGDLTDASFLNGMKNIKSVSLYAPKLKDFSSLAKAQSLESIMLTGSVDPTKPLDLSSFSELKKLNSFVLYGINTSKLDRFVQDHPDIEKLGLSGQEIKDIAPLRKLAKAREFVLRESALSNLSVLTSMRQLRHLDVSLTPSLVDLSGIEKLPFLMTLDVTKTSITDIKALDPARFLFVFYASSTKIEDLTPLLGASRLSIIELNDTPIANDPSKKQGLCLRPNLNPALKALCAL